MNKDIKEKSNMKNFLTGMLNIRQGENLRRARKIVLENVRLILLVVVFSLGMGVASAAVSPSIGRINLGYTWVRPDANPPSNNVAAPINIGSGDQIKTGGLWVSSLATDNGLLVTTSAHIGGVSAPTETLDVTGNVKASGNAYASAFLYSSDFNLKKNIEPLGSELDKVLALRSVSFDWKSDDSSDVGFVAQEVEKIFPEVVHTNEKTNLKTIDYPKLTVFLVKALQEQQKEIELLKSSK